MYYLDLLEVSKNYNRLFYYGFGRKSFKSKKFIISMIFLTLMIVGFFISSFRVLSFLNRDYAFIAMIVSEAAAILLYVAHKQIMIEEKIKDYFKIKTVGENIDNLKIRWLAENLPVSRENYLGLVKLADELDSVREQYRSKGISLLDRYLGLFSRIPQFGKWIIFILLSSSIPALIKAFSDNKEWTSYLVELMAHSNLNKVGIILLGVLVGGALISMIGSAFVIFTDYSCDVKSKSGCSKNSLVRFKKDLLLFSRIDIKEETEEGSSKKAKGILLKS